MSERIKLVCRRGKVIEPTRISVEKHGFLPRGYGRVRTWCREGDKTTVCLFTECESCGYGSKYHAALQKEDKTWNWDCEIKTCLFRIIR